VRSEGHLSTYLPAAQSQVRRRREKHLAQRGGMATMSPRSIGMAWCNDVIRKWSLKRARVHKANGVLKKEVAGTDWTLGTGGGGYAAAWANS
jgi:hypothetical protein